jgi:hypothetical protein
MADLLRPEFRFKPAPGWLLLPELARELGSNEEERDAVLQLLDAGAREARKLLGAEGAGNDVAAATALFLSQLWQVARGAELPGAAVDALHAQIVGVLAGPEVAGMSDADKQRHWEFCLGYPVFIAAMARVVEGEEHLAVLRKAAGMGFESLLGVSPEFVDIGPEGLTPRAGHEEAVARARNRAEAPAPPSLAGRDRLAATGPAISGIAYDAPAGWSRETKAGSLLFRATLGDVGDDGQPAPDNIASHQATIGILPVLTATEGPTALFDQTWRDQFAPFVAGDTFVHYRARLRSNLVVLYMGRFFERPDTPRSEGNPQTYGALYLVDLGDNRFQPLVALVEPRSGSISMDSFKEGAALRALSFPLAALLHSVRPARGAPPYPQGGFFASADLCGRWNTSGSALGGTYVNTRTGGFAGVAVTSSGGHFHLNADGTYDYSFAYASSHPQFGRSGGSSSHAGRYRLNGDIVLLSPTKPIGYDFTCCAVGVGVRRTPDGPRRILVTVSAHSDGTFHAPPLIPNWDAYSGVMHWYVEE